ncbi:hypothetical protein CRG98_016523, partial [Punica granatum]
DVDVGQREVVFAVGLVEVSVVDAYSDSSIILLHGYYICHPLGVVANFQESRVDLFNDLLFDAEEETGSLLS